VGDSLETTIIMGAFWNDMSRQYNEAAKANNWGLWPYNTGGTSKIVCSVRGFFSETFGKMPDEGADRQIILEYKYLTDTLATSTSFNSTQVD